MLGALLRLDDPCFLHYRSGALDDGARAASARGVDAGASTRCSRLCASAEDPIASGRHKVWGSRALWVPPQTEHDRLAPAEGRRARVRARRARGACGVDDRPARTTRSCAARSATRRRTTPPRSPAFNAARYAHRARQPRADPVRVRGQRHRHLGRDAARLDPRDASATCAHLALLRGRRRARRDLGRRARAAIEHCRAHARAGRSCTCDCVRLWGHAGSDVETDVPHARRRSRRSRRAIRCSRTRGAWSRPARRRRRRCAALVRDTRARVRAAGAEAARAAEARDARGGDGAARALRRAARARARRARAADRRAPPRDLRRRAARGARSARRAHARGARQRRAARRAAARRPRCCVFGEDVAQEGRRLRRDARACRSASAPRACSTRCSTRRRSSASRRARRTSASCRCPRSSTWPTCTTRSTSCAARRARSRSSPTGQFPNPMVVRIAGPRLPEGLRRPLPQRQLDRRAARHPGPRARRARARRRRGAHAARRASRSRARAGAWSCFLEPIALYHERDLYERRRRRLAHATTRRRGTRRARSCRARSASTAPRRTDLLIVSYAQRPAAVAARRARARARARRSRARVLDLRWLSAAAARRAARSTRAPAAACSSSTSAARPAAAIADALRRATSPSAASAAALRSVRAADSYVPLGPAADTVLLSDEEIVAAATRLARGARSSAAL